MTIKNIAWTGPSRFDENGVQLIEERLNSNPIILRQNNEAHLYQSLKICDAVIIAGGTDLHPSTYGASLSSKCNLTVFDIERDIRELLTIDYCLRENIPMLGICRGHQMLGSYFNIPFLQDINDSVTVHSPGANNIKANPNEPIHYVSLTPEGKENFTPEGPQLSNQTQDRTTDDALWVNSFHHQALQHETTVKTKQSPFTTLATGEAGAASKTLTIIELMEGKNWISCQWHPEWDWDSNIASEMVIANFEKLLS